MFEFISFSIGRKTIEAGEEEWLLGEISTEILNITPDDYLPMRKLFDDAKSEMHSYSKTGDLVHWKKANDYLIELDAMLCRYKIFRALRWEPSIVHEAAVLLDDLSVLKDHDFTLSREDKLIQRHIDVYEQYLYFPEDFGSPEEYQLTNRATGEQIIFESTRPVPPPPPEKSFNLLVCPGTLEMKWLAYQNICKGYEIIMGDLPSFNTTIHNFIKYFLSSLKTLNPSNYAAALYEFLNHPRADKLIANPFRGTGLYANGDPVTLRFDPRPVNSETDEYEIFEYYEAKNFQTLLKMDFYRALSAGHVIRKCEYCGRYFLLTKGYHTKYCDQPNPQHPEFTCAQLGYRQTGLKEAAKDDPLKQSLFRCSQRLNKDVSRGNLTAEEREILYEKAMELHFDARQTPEISFEAFDKSLATENLCALCGIQRRANKVGRPKRQEAEA